MQRHLPTFDRPRRRRRAALNDGTIEVGRRASTEHMHRDGGGARRLAEKRYAIRIAAKRLKADANRRRRQA